MNVITNEYGRGLYSLAEEKNIVEGMLNEIRAVSSLFTQEYIHLLINPDIPKDERISLVGNALDGRVCDYLSNFVKLLTERGLASEIKGCFDVFEDLYYESNNIVRVTAERLFKKSINCSLLSINSIISNGFTIVSSHYGPYNQNNKKQLFPFYCSIINKCSSFYPLKTCIIDQIFMHHWVHKKIHRSNLSRACDCPQSSCC